MSDHDRPRERNSVARFLRNVDGVSVADPLRIIGVFEMKHEELK
jgi:hypothetical protein